MNYLIAANWKMHKTADESLSFAKALQENLPFKVDVLLCPPFTSLPVLQETLKDTPILLGAQNIHQEQKGAFTGEVSADMIKNVGCTYVILGHSERRQYNNETNGLVNSKIKTALKQGLKVVLCVGETAEQRELGETQQLLKTQLTGCLGSVHESDMANVIVAYEPVWAIGTGNTATPQQANDAHVQIRTVIQELFGEKTAKNLIILYGGSVKPENASELFSQPDINGALVGGASLEVDSFLSIVQGTST